MILNMLRKVFVPFLLIHTCGTATEGAAPAIAKYCHSNSNHSTSTALVSIMVANPLNFSYFTDTKPKYARIIGGTSENLQSALETVKSDYSLCSHTFSCALNSALIDYINRPEFVDISYELWSTFCGKASIRAFEIFYTRFIRCHNKRTLIRNLYIHRDKHHHGI